jgi:hypothetical protein
VVLCHGVTPRTAAGLFSPNNLLQGRVDVWCRCITAGLYLSDDFRKDTLVSLVLSGEGEGNGEGEGKGEGKGEGVSGDDEDDDEGLTVYEKGAEVGPVHSCMHPVDP